MADNYGIVTFDNEGPINTWERLASVQAHNNRDRNEPHCDPDGPKPLHFVGRGNLVADVKARLREHDIDPAGLRKNGNIAFEAVLSASRSFFQAVTEDERWGRIADFVMAARKAAEAAWGRFRIVSLVLHLDEYTPHIHVVILPLVKKVYQRWPEKGEVWALVGRTICGPGEYQRIHDVYAAHMAPLGLRRGEADGRVKYRPYADELEELAAEKEKAKVAQEEAAKLSEQARQDSARHSAEWRDRFDRQEQIKADQDAREKAIGRSKALLREDVLRLALDRRTFEKQQQALVVERTAAARARAEAAAERASLADIINALAPTMGRVSAVRDALSALPSADLSPKAIAALATIQGFEDAFSAVTESTDADDAIGAHLQQLFQRGKGRC